MMRGVMKTLAALPAPIASSGLAAAQSPERVKTLEPPGAIKTTGPRSLGRRAGDFVYGAGMRGIDPATNTLVQGEEARIRQGFLNMKMIAESEGASPARLRAHRGLRHRHVSIPTAGEQGPGGALGPRGPIRRVPSSRSTASIRTIYS